MLQPHEMDITSLVTATRVAGKETDLGIRGGAIDYLPRTSGAMKIHLQRT